MAGLTDSDFARFLKANRQELNARFAATRREHRGLTPERFARTLTDVVAPTFEQIGVPQEAAERTGLALYRCALTLEAQGLFTPSMHQAWRSLVPTLAPLMRRGDEALIGAMANAVVKLDRSGRGRPDQWVATMGQVTPLVDDATSWLQAGQVAAWHSGVAAYRRQALAVADRLAPVVIATIFGCSEDALVDDTIDALRADPWFDPAAEATASPSQPIRLGGFRGFGGPFINPPVVTLIDGDVIAADGTGSWQILADAFGSDLIRVAATPDAPPPPMAPSKAAVAVAPTGAGPAASTDVPEVLASIPEVTSWTRSPLGLVATSGLSHCVLLVGPTSTRW